MPRHVLALSVIGVVGCLSPQDAKQDADETAYRIIEQKQAAALGTTRPFTIETPEDQLRRRLMIEQRLPAVGPASFGRRHLPPVPHQPEGVTGNEPLPEDANLIPPREVNTAGTRTPTLSTDIALHQIGGDPGSAAASAEPMSGERIRLEIDEATVAVEPLMITLVDALQLGARGSRTYQSQKEAVFTTALNLDFERDQFEFRFAGLLDANIQSDLEGADQTGVVVSPSIGISKAFKSGAALSTRIGLDLARLLNGDGGESLGLFADASVTIPLLRGAGAEVVTENLLQAERDTVYSIWDFERFKREFAVDVAAQYFGVLQALDAIANSEANYERLRYNSERSRAFFEEGELPAIQVDQAVSNELAALTRLISAQQRYEEQLDRFKVFLGLPPDAALELDRTELSRLTPLAERVIGPGSRELLELYGEETAAGQSLDNPATPTTLPGVDVSEENLAEPTDVNEELEMFANPYDRADELYRRSAFTIALANRLDLSIRFAQVADAQRGVVVAADTLEGVLDLSLGANAGSRRGAFSGNLDNDLDLNLSDGSYSGGLRFDLPIERTGERNNYRVALISLERAIRTAQEAEDGVKLDVLSALRSLRVAADNLRIQAQAIQVAKRRVASANLLLELGRGEVRDVTEAEDALVDAQNGFTAALVTFYLSELELQRDLGVLEVDENGLYSTVLDMIGDPTP